MDPTMQPLETVGEGLVQVMRGFIAQLPLIVLGLAVRIVLLGGGRIVRQIVCGGPAARRSIAVAAIQLSGVRDLHESLWRALADAGVAVPYPVQTVELRMGAAIGADA